MRVCVMIQPGEKVALSLLRGAAGTSGRKEG